MSHPTPPPTDAPQPPEAHRRPSDDATARDPLPPGGEVVGPDDLRFGALLEGRNLRRSRHPREVVRCTHHHQVEDAVRRAVARGWRISPSSGGPDTEDSANHEGGEILLDLSALEGVAFDPATGRVTLEAGITLGRAHHQLFSGYGLALPAAPRSCRGLAGHVLAGGHGPLARCHGLAVDFLTGIDVVVVDADGRPRTVHAGRESTEPALRELFWAHRGGGGGNFGIVTRFHFTGLPPAPRAVRLVSWAWEWKALDIAHFRDLVRCFTHYFAQNNAPDSLARPLFASLHLGQRAAGQIVLTVLDLGAEPAVLADFLALVERAAGPPVSPRIAPDGLPRPVQTTAIRSLSWPAALRALDPSGPDQRRKVKSAFLKRPFHEHQLPVLWVYLNESHPNPAAFSRIDSWGGRIGELAHPATAVPHRSSIFALHLQTAWDHPRGDADNLRWIRDFYRALFGPRGPWPDDRVDGCSVGCPDEDLEDWEYLYYQDLYPRLQAVKAAWDPANRFRHRQSIRPSVPPRQPPGL